MKLSNFVLSVFVLTASCAAPEAQAPGPVYRDLPEADSYWVPEGVEVSKIIAAAAVCGARVDGGVYHHIPIPPGFANHGFHFVGENSSDAMICTVNRLGAVLAFRGRSRSRTAH